MSPRALRFTHPMRCLTDQASAESAWCCRELRHAARSGVNLAEMNTRDPVSFAPVESRLLVLRVECGRSKPEAGAVYTLESVDADDGIGVTVDLARNYGNDTADGADMELGRLRTEDIPRDLAWIND